ncbi:hypothetical protein V1505DRAFT_53797 [Lipomyces doorenjongii]
MSGSTQFALPKATKPRRQLGEITYLFHDAKCVIAAPWLARTIGPVQLYDDYVQRCWVIAEIASAKCIYYTNWNWKENYMNYSCNNPTLEGFCPPGINPSQMKADEKETHQSMSNRVVILRKQRKFGEFHVDEIVKIAVELKATKEHDKLYALMPTAGKRVERSNFGDLQSVIRHFMETLEPINRLRLAIGVSRFRNHASVLSSAWASGSSRLGRSPSWSFGQGADYLAPWAVDEYLETCLQGRVQGSGLTLHTSVVLEKNHSLIFTGFYHHVCQLLRGNRARDSQYYCSYFYLGPGQMRLVFCYPQLDNEKHAVTLCAFGLDRRGRIVGIIVEQNEKIGTFMGVGLENFKWGSVVIS